MSKKLIIKNMLKLYRERFANAGKFVFTVVGNVKPADFKPLVEQYIASIPGKAEKSKFNPDAMKMRKGKFNRSIIRRLGSKTFFIFRIIWYFITTCKYHSSWMLSSKCLIFS